MRNSRRYEIILIIEIIISVIRNFEKKVCRIDFPLRYVQHNSKTSALMEIFCTNDLKEKFVQSTFWVEDNAAT